MRKKSLKNLKNFTFQNWKGTESLPQTKFYPIPISLQPNSKNL